MEPRQRYKFLQWLLGLQFGVIAGAIAVFFLLEVNIGLPFMGTVLAALMGLVALSSMLVTSRMAPTAVISLIGESNSGKTVYLTALFDLLSRQASDGLAFRPYGTDTSRRVTHDMSILRGGRWLDSTGLEVEVPYRATAILRPSTRFASWLPVLSKRYTVEIKDFAGARSEALAETMERWQKSQLKGIEDPTAKWLVEQEMRAERASGFLHAAAQADGFILAVDLDRLLNPTRLERAEYLGDLEFMLEGIAHYKEAVAGGKIRAPIAIALMKLDLVEKAEPEYQGSGDPASLSKLPLHVRSALEQLEDRARRISKQVAMFGVTSVGKLDPDGHPVENMQPSGVVEPMIWMLRRSA